MKLIKLLLPGLLGIFIFSIISPAQKLSLDEVLAKHLDSIGTKEKRLVVKNMVMLSDVSVVVKGGSSVLKGKAVVASQGEKNIWGMNLNSLDYAQDSFGFNGKETKVAYIRPGVRSVLGGFIYTNKELLGRRFAWRGPLGVVDGNDR